MLQRLRERLILILIILLPFHALIVTVGTRLLVGPGHAPLPGMALWKEGALGLILVLTCVEWIHNAQLKMKNEKLPMDVLDWLIIGLLVLGVSVSATHYQLPTTHLLFGFKYTLFPLLLFLILRRVSWSEHFLLRTSYFVLLTGAIVAAYGILTLFLPDSFFAWLGYSGLHSLYLPDNPLAAFQKIEGTGIRRIQSTFSGPNQLGVWLLVPWSVTLVLLERMKNQELGIRSKEFLLLTSYFLLLLLALLLAFSRAAWIGAVVMLLVVALHHVSSRRVRCWLLVAGCSFLVVLVSLSALLRPRSTAEHLRRPLQALWLIAAHPLGLGLGSAGPAANRTGDACVFLEEGADVSWAVDRPSLCVFRGDQQVQPFDAAQGKPIPCRCPFLPENWYLQVGVELGVLGLILYCVLVGVIGYWLLVMLHAPISLSFIGISVTALFLHAWEDSAVAYTVWILFASVLQPPCRSRHSSLS